LLDEDQLHCIAEQQNLRGVKHYHNDLKKVAHRVILVYLPQSFYYSAGQMEHNEAPPNDFLLRVDFFVNFWVYQTCVM
jgi:hypothetical protein